MTTYCVTRQTERMRRSLLNKFTPLICLSFSEKRKRGESPPPPNPKNQKWDSQTTGYQKAMADAVSGKRITFGTKGMCRLMQNRFTACSPF